ncbi:MAG: ABC transporter permease [Eubacterium sp.]
MLIWENVKLAFQALLANKMRALLTMLGIIIGIGAVIAIMTVSSSLTNSISDSFQEMGANNITVGLKQTSSTTETRSNGLKFGAANRNSMVEKEDLITDDMLSELKTEFSDKIDAIAISETVASGTVHDGSNTANISISGINSEYFSSDDVTLLAGRRLTSDDNTGKKKVIMISDKVVDQIFDGDSQKALSQKIQVEIDGVYYQYYVVGVYKYESNNSFSSSSDEDITTTAYIPILTGKAQTHSDEGYQQFTVVTKSGIDSVSTFATQIENFFAPYYSSNEDYKVSTTTMESMTESMSDMIGTVSIAISFIAGISLLVGGIGVMNIMLVSITERTREIGTRKALGAKNSSIRFQFIIESMILCLIGGILGIFVGFLLGAIAASILGYSAAVPVAAIIVAVGFSMVIGIFFGYYPANKAARMDPIEALRYE